MLKSLKKTVVQDLALMYNESSAVVITHYHGLTVSDLYALRANLKKVNAGFKIIKNTLAKIAANDIGIDNEVQQLFTGPVGIAYAKEPLAVSKILVEFAKKKTALKIVGGIVDKSVVDSAMINRFATLPSMNEIRSKLLNMLNTPATQIARMIKQRSEEIEN